ncbi:hypothetical protein BU23DRAFT_600398 [Bimuria novae-zelandiae CBS 107.79]|uniref:Uncharacterized protein n=1 Tax=Bimuria novae-zelandiae CBS 107.79 TaxID=1447943 RepID=A0A6A5V4W0_9PLEO|nr:hypothetical protein BU23DRAFT_600398 [Bimuria novae-zelandiae CBS 107.79]
MSDPITNDSRADRMSDAAYDSDLDDTTMDFDSRPTQEDDTYHGEEEDEENELFFLSILKPLLTAIRSVFMSIRKEPHQTTLSHTHVTSETWEQMRNSRLNIYRTERDERKKKSTSLYSAVTGRFHSGIACPNQKVSCAPVLRQMRHQTVSGIRPWYIGCASWSWQTANTERHFYRAVGDKYNVEYLQNLFENSLPHELEQRDTCGVVLSTRTKLKDCDVDYSQGKGKLVRVLCGVTFNIIIPFDLQESTFLKSSFLDEFCQKHNKSTFIQVHQSLSNLDRLRQTIYRKKLIMFPAGQDMAGVQFEKQMRHQDPEEAYIQDILTNMLGTVVLTMRKEQAIIFSKIEAF